MGNSFILEPHIRLRNLNQNLVQIAANNQQNLENEFEVMFGGPPVSFLHYLEGPNVSYVPRSRADENAEPTPIKIRSTVKIQNPLYINKNSIKLYSFEPEEEVEDVPQGEENEREILNPLNNSKNSQQSSKQKSKVAYFGIQFDFDCTIDCDLYIYFFAKEKKNQRLNYYHFDAQKRIGPISFKSGMKHEFKLPDEFALPLSQLDQGSLLYNEERRNFYPIVLELRSMDYSRKPGDASYHFTYLAFEKSSLSSDSSTYSIKILKQKIQHRGQAFMLADVYSNLMDSSALASQQENTENKSSIATTSSSVQVEIGEESEEHNLCVICITDVADSCIIPCRHCCLCSECSKALKQQSNKCPICRTNIQSFIRLPRSEDGTLLEVDTSSEQHPSQETSKPSVEE